MKDEAEKLWGVANPRRGSNYEVEAKQFVSDFPIGTTLTNIEFDAWAHLHGYLNVPPADVDKQSDVWLAHLTRRNQLRTNIFKASTNHSKLGEQCFVITMSKGAGGGMIVETPSVALQQMEFSSKIESLLGTKRRQLGYLMQSVDFAQLPPHQKALSENLYDELSGWNRVLRLQTEIFDERMSKLIRNIRHDLDAGLIVVKNHAITNLLTNKECDLPDFLTE
jgi:hypothetical protein